MIQKLNQLKSITIYGFGQLFNLVTPLLVIPYIISICGEENFGKTAVGMAISFFLMVFIDYGSDIIGVRAVSINRNDNQKLNQIFNTTFFVKSFILFIVLLIFCVLIFQFSYFKNEMNLFLFGLTVLIGQWLNPTWFLQGVENVKWITYLNIISKSIYLIGIFTIIKQKNDYHLVNFLWGFGMTVSHLFFLILVIKKYNFNSIKFNKNEVLKHIKNEFSFFYSQIFVSMQMYAPVIIVSYFGSNLMAGQFRIIEQIIVIFRTYILLFFNFLFPKICYLLKENLKNGYKNWIIYNSFNFLFVLLSMIVLFVFSKQVVSYFSVNHNQELSKLLKIAIIIPILFTLSNSLKQLVLAFNFNSFYVKTTTVIVLITLGLMLLLLQKNQVFGVFYSLILSEILVIIIYLYKLKNKF